MLVLIKDLPTILELLKNLFGKFNYKLDMQQAKELTIAEAIKKFGSGIYFYVLHSLLFCVKYQINQYTNGYN